jgi:hypothetical protein
MMIFGTKIAHIAHLVWSFIWNMHIGWPLSLLHLCYSHLIYARFLISLCYLSIDPVVIPWLQDLFAIEILPTFIYSRYTYSGIDYPTHTGMFYHHINIPHPSPHLSGAGRLSLIVRKNPVLNHRHLIIGHLIYLSIALGLHSFSLYIHFITYNPLGVLFR